MDVLKSGCAKAMELNEWDMLPMLFSVHLAGDGVGLTFWDMPEEFWNDVGPPEALVIVAGVLHAKLAEIPDPAAMLAVGFLCEGWATRVDMAGEPSVLEALREHRLKDHDARIECRIFSAIDREGGSYMIQWNRDEPAPVIETVARLGDDNQPGGAVFRGLDLIAHEVMGVSVPERELSLPEGADGGIRKPIG